MSCLQGLCYGTKHGRVRLLRHRNDRAAQSVPVQPAACLSSEGEAEAEPEVEAEAEAEAAAEADPDAEYQWTTMYDF